MQVKVSSGTVWEQEVGYSRAIKAGKHVLVSGTVAANEQGQVVGLHDIAAQTAFIIQKIEKALQQLGAGLQQVVRTRMYITDTALWPEAGKVHGQYFKDICPATTLVVVKALIQPEFLIEIEADAIIE